MPICMDSYVVKISAPQPHPQHSALKLQLSEEEEEASTGGEKTMVSWLVGRCVDSLLALDHEAVRGIYIQVRQTRLGTGGWHR